MPRPRKSASPATPAAPAAAAAPAAPAMTKSQAVREALAAGIESPEEGVAWIRDKYGLEMKATHFSAVKAHERRRGIGGNSGDAIAAMETLKPLVLSHGIEKVKRMVELCG